MNRILVLMVLMVGILPIAHAWSWQDAGSGTYQNVYNISVNNWSYSASYGAQTFKSGRAGFVLVNLTLESNYPNQVSVVGYSSDKNKIGTVPFWVVGSSYNSILLLISNTTNSTTQYQPWSFVSLFYNPTIQTQTTNCPNYFEASSPNFVICSSNTTRKFTSGNISFTIFDAPLFFNLYPYPFAENGTARLNFSVNSVINGFVVLSNRTWDNIKFNISWFPRPYYSPFTHGYQLSNISSGYRLISYRSCGILCAPYSLTNLTVISKNANEIFPFNFDGLGFEAYFGSTPYQVLTEGIYADESKASFSNAFGTMYNSSTSTGLGYDATSFIYAQFGLNISSKAPQTIYIMPSFTKNFTIINYTNPNPSHIDNSLIISANATLVDNINWSYTFNEYAFPNNNIQNRLIYGTADVPFLLFTIPHYVSYGTSCQNIYISATNNLTSIPLLNYRSIPYSIINCGNRNITLLLSNTTTDAFNYNSFIIYDLPPNEFTSNYPFNYLQSNYTIFTGNYGQIYLPSNEPFIINLNDTLNLNSYIVQGDGSGSPIPNSADGLSLRYNGIADNLRSQASGSCESSSDSGNIGDFNLNNNTQIIVGAPNNLPSIFPYAWLDVFSTRNLFAGYRSTSIADQWNLYNIMGNSSTGFYCDNNYISIVLRNTKATVNKLASSSYTIEQSFKVTTFNPSACVSISNCIPTIPVQLPQTANGISTNNTTTIPINSTYGLVTLAPGVQFPKWYIQILSVIFIMMGAAMLSNHELGHFPFVVMIIGLWILGIFQYQILAVAIIATMAFVIEEFIGYKHGRPFIMGNNNG